MMASVDAAGLLRAILENPADDAPRLVYADEIEEREPERAEFVRVQVELARLSKEWRRGPGSPNGIDPNGPGATIRRRERELWEENSLYFADRDFGPIGQINGVSHCRARVPVGEDGDDWIECAWTRGFVSAVTLDSATFFGGTCQRCNDNWIRAGGYSYESQGDPKCERCSGTGERPGIAAKLFQSQPITSVRLTDREPASGYHRSADPRDAVLYDGRPFWYCCGYGTAADAQRHWVPKELAEFMGGSEGRRKEYANGRAFYFDTVEAAQLALSPALVAYGRQLAGLPITPEAKGE